MFARIFAPALLAFGMLACTTDLPLEAQRGQEHARRVTSGVDSLVWLDQGAQLADGRGFGGTFSITEIVQGSDGTLLASGTVEGSVVQNGTLTAVSESYTGVPVVVYSQVSSCTQVLFDLGPIPLAGSSVDFAPRDVWKSTTDQQLFRALCGVIKGLQVEQNLATINAIIGG